MADKNSKIKLQREEHFQKIGMRFRELRLMEGLSHKDIETELEFSALTISRFEDGKGINSKSLMSLIEFFSNKGYNLNWMLLYENKNAFKKEQNFSLNVDIHRAEEFLESIVENSKDLQKILGKII